MQGFDPRDKQVPPRPSDTVQQALDEKRIFARLENAEMALARLGEKCEAEIAATIPVLEEASKITGIASPAVEAYEAHLRNQEGKAN